MPWTTDAEIKTAVTNALGMSDTSLLPSKWTPIITASNQGAYDEIRAILAQRGYTPAQLDTWDRRVEFNRSIALCRALQEGAVDATTLAVNLDPICKRREELTTVILTADGVYITPAGTGRISIGTVDTTDDTFTMDTVL